MATRRLLVVLALFPATGPAASALDVNAMSTRLRLRVEIVFDGMPMPPKLEESAMKEARLIWQPYGVDVHTSGECDVDDGAVRLAVSLVDHETLRAFPDALGSIQFNSGVPEPAIAMYPDKIAALVSTVELFGRNERTFPAAIHNLVVGRALGRALAHEIGHFLLRTRRHSPAGLMRALQPIRSLVETDRRLFVLSPDEVARLMSTQSASFGSSAPLPKGD
jgi:hypothetical protein